MSTPKPNPQPGVVVIQDTAGKAKVVVVRGANGQNGVNGRNGLNGANGRNGAKGRNGANGKNSANGKNGANGGNGDGRRPERDRDAVDGMTWL